METTTLSEVLAYQDTTCINPNADLRLSGILLRGPSGRSTRRLSMIFSPSAIVWKEYQVVVKERAFGIVTCGHLPWSRPVAQVALPSPAYFRSVFVLCNSTGKMELHRACELLGEAFRLVEISGGDFLGTSRVPFPRLNLSHYRELMWLQRWGHSVSCQLPAQPACKQARSEQQLSTIGNLSK